MAVVHDALRGSADAMRRLSGLADYPYVHFDRPAGPTAAWSEGEIRDLVERLVPEVIARLTDEGARE